MIHLPLDVTVVVATFGAAEWHQQAQERAVPSAKALDVPVVHVHGSALHTARNEALKAVTTPWVVHLDADDELEGGYVVAAGRVAATSGADVIVPQVRYIHPSGSTGVAHMPRVYNHTDHECDAACLPYGNWIVVGAPVRTELAQSVGWEDWPRYEDWAFWLECHRRNASFAVCPDAIYRAHVRPVSRNMRHAPESGVEVHRMIALAKGVPVP